MKSNPIDQNATPLLLQELEGTLERITYQNEENGYTVARLIPRGKSNEVTIIGNFYGINIGELLRLEGIWVTHPQYGRQFEVRKYTIQLPATIEGLCKYLGSGLIKGIGPANARRIVDHFGMDTLDIIETSPHRLREVPGVGDKRAEIVALAWAEQKQIKDIMLFLQSNGVSTSLAVKIFKQYGDQSIQVVRSNPYQLAGDIFGIGFKTADQLARQLGLPPDSPMRIQAGILYALGQQSDEGHCFAEPEVLCGETSKILELNPEMIRSEINKLIIQGDLISEDEAIYLPPFYYAETGVANKLQKILHSVIDRLKNFQQENWEQAFSLLDESATIQLTTQQKEAVRNSLTQKVSILTGGPGTGKSTITGSIIKLLRARNKRVLLAAPTGRAAKRLSEATGLEAKTIHRLLEFSPSIASHFVRDQSNPLDTDMIIIDETSMVDVLLMNHLLSAVDNGSHLLLVGDVDQLPSVGPGNVLKDIISSGQIPVTRLDTIFRQAEDSFIITNAHRINHGVSPEFSQNAKDFFLFAEEDSEKAAKWVVDIVTQRIPAKFGLDPFQDIQVLSPMHRGSVGVSELNQQLQAALNPPGLKHLEIRHGGRFFREQDRVMQIVNNYEKQVFNGDLGQITNIDLEDQILTVSFDGRPVQYELIQLEELQHAYAISIHKAQGSEFPCVVIPLLTQHYMMLQRNLLYTGVTRAKKLVVMVGSRKAIAMAVRNNRIAQRNTRLSIRLSQSVKTEKSFQYKNSRNQLDG